MSRNTFVSGFIAEVAPALCAQPPCGLTFADDATDWIAELPRYPVHVTDWPTDKGAVSRRSWSRGSGLARCPTPTWPVRPTATLQPAS